MAAKAVVSACVLLAGFHAISDDDFARVTIAQRFAIAPALDPSGSSWLPLPFWILGTIMSVFERTLDVARTSAFGLGVASAALLHVAARWFGMSRSGALLGALVASCLPYFAWLGVATVPEAPTAALMVLGVTACVSDVASRRLLGGLALASACLSRYEAWPVALLFAFMTLGDALRKRSWLLTAAALLPIAAPVGWMLHGALSHGDPLFFVARVANYRRALAADSSPIWLRISSYPVALLRAEPELCALSLLSLIAAMRLKLPLTELLERCRRPAALIAALVGFLIVGELRDGAPTHHGERALLAIWLFAALVVGELLTRAWQVSSTGQRLAGLASMLAVLAVVALVVRPWSTREIAFVDRRAEVEIGKRAAELIADRGDELAQSGGKLAISSRDLGFFAVMAGFGRPEQTKTLDDHDPRTARLRHAASGPRKLKAELEAAGAAWLIVPVDTAANAAELGHEQTRNARYALFRISP